MDLEDEDLDELIGERYPWRAVGPLMKQEWRIMETLGDMEDDFEKAEKKIEKGLRWAAKRYGPELKAWGDSNIVKAKKVHDKMIEKSKYGQRIGHAFSEDAMTPPTGEKVSTKTDTRSGSRTRMPPSSSRTSMRSRKLSRLLSPANWPLSTVNSEQLPSKTNTSRTSSECS
jgi:hypothetical protein